MERTIRASTRSGTRSVGRVYRRVRPPRWPFFLYGLLPLLGLLVLIGFGVTRFAGHWIEDQARQRIESALQSGGHGWATLSLSGQRAVLSGSPTSPASGEAALQAARSATCPTWLGPRVCAVSVTGDFAGAATPPASPDATAPTSAAAAMAAACETELASIVDSERVEFASGRADVAPTSRSLLDRIADVARECPGVIHIEGHTDSTGDAAANQTLSAARAEAVRQALGARGIPLDRLVATGHGQTRPLADNETPEGRARNRRIEFRVQIDGN